MYSRAPKLLPAPLLSEQLRWLAGSAPVPFRKPHRCACVHALRPFAASGSARRSCSFESQLAHTELGALDEAERDR